MAKKSARATTQTGKPATKPAAASKRRAWTRLRQEFRAFKPPTDPRSATAADVKAQLRAFHDLGKLINDELGERGDYGDGTMARLAESAGYSRGWITKLRRFEQVYRDQEVFDELCSLAPAIKWSHVQLLITIADPKDRKAFQAKAAKNSWSRVELGRQVARKLGRRNKGGRPQKKPSGFAPALLTVIAHSETYRKHLDTAMSVLIPFRVIKREANRKLVDEARRVLEEVGERVGDAVRRLKGK